MTFLFALVVFLLLNLVGGLVRILRGPARGDRMLAAQLFGTTGVAVLVVLAEAMGEPALRDVALVFALLAVVNTVVFVRRAGRGGETAP
jgi:multicomponent Na+:H+ antiporter subunit F